MNKVYEIIAKHKAATGFFTSLTYSPGGFNRVPRNFQTVIEELEFFKQNSVSETEQTEAQMLINEYRELSRITLLAISGDNLKY